MKFVEHPCHQCGVAVDDGIAFCPHCQAPQIRVTMAAPEQTTLAPPEARQTGYGAVSHPSGLIWQHALPAAAQAGLIAAILMIIPLGALFGLGTLLAGFLAVLFYRRRLFDTHLTAGLGARLGALSGMIGFGIFALFTALETAIFHAGGELRTALMQAIDQAASKNTEPQAQQMLHYLKSPQGLALVMIMGLMVMFVLFLALSSLGGVIGSALLRRKERQ